MANTYRLGETLICSAVVKNSAGALTNPATSMQIFIPGRLAATSMTNDGTGLYHYDYIPIVTGDYEIEYIATDSTRVSKYKETVTVT